MVAGVYSPRGQWVGRRDETGSGQRWMGQPEMGAAICAAATQLEEGTRGRRRPGARGRGHGRARRAGRTGARRRRGCRWRAGPAARGVGGGGRTQWEVGRERPRDAEKATGSDAKVLAVARQLASGSVDGIFMLASTLAADLTGLSQKTAHNALARMVQRGQLELVKASRRMNRGVGHTYRIRSTS